MAFDRANLERVAGGQRQMFMYKTADTIATVDTDGYFNDATNELREHDVINVVANTGGAETIDNLFVSSATGAAIVTTGGLEGLAAD